MNRIDATFCSLLLVGAAACEPALSSVSGPASDAGSVGADASSRPDALASAAGCAEAEALAGESQPCCPYFGPDACGAGLSCASLDGRTIATCFVDHSRRAGESCTEDRQCEHGSCNLDVGRCRASDDDPCTREVGCVPDADGQRRICRASGGALGDCYPSSGAVSAYCELDEDCLDGRCVRAAYRCGSGRGGDVCDDGADCNEGLCLEHECQDGSHDSPCEADAQCDSGRCITGRCSEGRLGDGCRTGADCASAFCNLGTGRCGDVCTSPAQCETGLICTRSGQCVPPGAGEAEAPCRSDHECRSGSCFPYRPSAGESFCAHDGGADVACDAEHPCAAGYLCDGARCAILPDHICGFQSDELHYVLEACAGSLICSASISSGRRCLTDLARCASAADCGGAPCGWVYACR